MDSLSELKSILQDTRALLAREGNDFTWSSWKDRTAALREVDALLARVERGKVPKVAVLYAPTGPIQEVALSSGWANEFIALAERFDRV